MKNEIYEKIEMMGGIVKSKIENVQFVVFDFKDNFISRLEAERIKTFW